MDNDIKKSLIEVSGFIDNRYKKLGRSVGTAGWSSVETQSLRFQQLLNGFDLENKTILDIGCGLGDLYNYINQVVTKNFNYIGIDISNSVIEDARSKYNGSNALFYNDTLENIELEKIDISVASGAFSYRFKGSKQYTKYIFNRMFDLSSIGISANFLSSYCDYQLDKNQHYDPKEVLEWALGLSRKVIIDHDYGLYEFTIFVKK